MLKVGLTGNIGSGKSLVAKIFSTLGTPVYLADEESKNFLHTPGVTSEIVKTFGPEIMSPSGDIDRRKLGNLVFSDPKSLNFLNSILHPLVMENFAEWCRKHSTRSYIILESAIIFESSYQDEFDRVIHVSCPPEVAVGRVIRRDKVSHEEVLKRARNQMEDSKKAAMADFLIRNDGSELVIPQVLSIHYQLLQIPA